MIQGFALKPGSPTRKLKDHEIECIAICFWSSAMARVGAPVTEYDDLTNAKTEDEKRRESEAWDALDEDERADWRASIARFGLSTYTGDLPMNRAETEMAAMRRDRAAGTTDQSAALDGAAALMASNLSAGMIEDAVAKLTAARGAVFTAADLMSRGRFHEAVKVLQRGSSDMLTSAVVCMTVTELGAPAFRAVQDALRGPKVPGTMPCPWCGLECKYKPRTPAEPKENVPEWRGGYVCAVGHEFERAVPDEDETPSSPVAEAAAERIDAAPLVRLGPGGDFERTYTPALPAR